MTALPPPRILCVDDNPTFLQTLELGFKACCFEVVTAAHGVDALMQLQTYGGNFAAILIENDMLKINGPAFVKAARALGYRGRILVMSGRLTVADGRAYQDLEISGFLSKPFEISMVATMLMYVG
jgi:CheY-like chemotaxis protein